MQLVMMLFYFNPRGRKDLDGRIKTALKRKDISIHEVAKTSTTISSSVLCSTIYFNPRGRKDLDTVPHHGRKAEGYFNPRGRKDLDWMENIILIRPLHFNPRGRKDLDNLSQPMKGLSSISIHEVAKTSTIPITVT